MAEKKPISEMLAAKIAPVKTFVQAEKAKGGRPRKEKGEKAKENRFATYYTNDELAIVEEAAKAYGLTVGKFIKMATLMMARQDKK
jgi:hypothetical protein